jgi:nicotinamidase-related amidase
MSAALLVIDVQNELVDALPPERRSTLLETIAELLSNARARQMPVVFVRHNEDEGSLRLGTPSWEIPDAIAPRETEPIVEKRFGDAFVETDLAELLKARNVDELIVCGMQSDFCVNATTRGAVALGYRITLVEDAHATYDANGKTERQIIDELHAALRGLSVRTVPAGRVWASDSRTKQPAGGSAAW